MKVMKQIAAICALLIAGATQVVHAESNNIELMISESWGVTGTAQVKIPFAFSVHGKTLEAGAYSITPNGDKEIVIKAASGKTAVVALTNTISVAPNSAAPKLVFHRYGDQYFLAQTWLRTSDEGRALSPSREEQEAARQARQLRASAHAGK